MMLLSSRKGQNKNFEKVGHYRELSEEFFSRINENTGDRKHYVEFMKNNPYIAKRKFINVNQRQRLGAVFFGKLCGTASAQKGKLCDQVR